MGIYSQFKGMHHYIEDSSILTLSYPGSRVDQLWSKLEDIAIITIILNPGCQQPFLIRMASDNRLSAAVFGPKWLVTTGCQQPLPKINKTVWSQRNNWRLSAYARASFMLPKCLCAALSWHAHICAYTPMSAKSEKIVWKKLYIQIEIEVNDMRRSRAFDNHLVPIRTS